MTLMFSIAALITLFYVAAGYLDRYDDRRAREYERRFRRPYDWAAEPGAEDPGQLREEREPS